MSSMLEIHGRLYNISGLRKIRNVSKTTIYLDVHSKVSEQSRKDVWLQSSLIPYNPLNSSEATQFCKQIIRDYEKNILIIPLSRKIWIAKRRMDLRFPHSVLNLKGMIDLSTLFSTQIIKHKTSVWIFIILTRR